MSALDLDDVLNPPPDHLKAPILKDLREDEGRLEHNLELLESWISCQSHLPKNYERQLLITFLRCSKHDMQRTKKKLERYFMTRTFEEALFRNRVMTLERDLMVRKYGFVCIMPELTQEGNRIIVNLAISKDEFTLNVLQYMRYILMILSMMHSSAEINAPHNSQLIFGCITRLYELWKVIDFAQNAYPGRLKQIHFATTKSVVVKLVDVAKKMLSDKLAKRIYIRSNWESVFKVIPQRLFPSDYGGEKKSICEIVEQWNKKFVEFEGWFRKLDEVKASGPIPEEFKQIFSDVYGPEGSFRQINLD